MVSFTIDGTIDGAQYVFGPNRSIFVRIFWICLFGLSIFGLFYYIHLSYIKWLIDPDIITKNRIRGNDEFPLFAVTVCPLQLHLSAFNASELRERIRKDKNTAISAEECALMNAYQYWCYQAFGLKIAHYFADSVHCVDKDLTLNWLKLRSTIFKEYKGFEVPEEYKKYYDVTPHNVLTTAGACTTFRNLRKNSFFKDQWMDDAYGLTKDENDDEWNSDLEPQKKNRNKGTYLDQIPPLRMETPNASSEETCNKVKGVSAYRVLIHQPNEIATFYHPSVDVEYGMVQTVFVKTKSERSNENLRTLDPDVRKCYFEDEGNLKYFKRYSKYHCIVECMSRYEQSYLPGCESLEIPRNETLSDREIFCEPSIPRYESNHPSAEICKCYPNCNYLRYELKVDIPSEEDNNTHLWVHRDLAFLEETEKFITYTVANFVADIGGYLGLFLGCSILSIIEIFFFIFAKILDLARRLRGNNSPIDESQKGCCCAAQIQELKEVVRDLVAKVESMQNESSSIITSDLIVEDIE